VKHHLDAPVWRRFDRAGGRRRQERRNEDGCLLYRSPHGVPQMVHMPGPLVHVAPPGNTSNRISVKSVSRNASRDLGYLDHVFSSRFDGRVRTRGFKWLGSALVFAAALLVGAARTHAQDRNKCGCYRDGATCYCDKQAKCGCPGECEPKGCEEKRNRELEKQIEAETKKASSGQKQPGREHDTQERAPAKPKMTAAQSKQLAKLIDLFLADHPDARSRSLEDVRNDLAR
jgi:hypothetical protein